MSELETNVKYIKELMDLMREDQREMKDDLKSIKENGCTQLPVVKEAFTRKADLEPIKKGLADSKSKGKWAQVFSWISFMISLSILAYLAGIKLVGI